MFNDVIVDMGLKSAEMFDEKERLLEGSDPEDLSVEERGQVFNFSVSYANG